MLSARCTGSIWQGVGAMPRSGTDRQRAFARAVVRGEFRTTTDAWESVYGAGGSRKTRVNEASRGWRNPAVQSLAQEERRALEVERSRRAAGDREAVRTRLWALADGAARDADRLTALRLLGSVAGVDLFATRLEVAPAPRESSAEIVAEIEQTLRDALGPEVREAEVVLPDPPTPLLPARVGENP